MSIMRKIKPLVFSLLILSILILMPVCSVVSAINPPTATPTLEPPTETPTPSPSPTLPPPTDTPEPTATSAPTQEPLPPLAVVPDGVNPWCLTTRYFITHEDGPYGPASMPEKARAGTVNKQTSVISFPIPAVSCTLVLAFNQNAPAGMKLEVWDARPQEPFITYDMQINPNNPKEAYAVMTHTYIINPPKWWMDYTLVVVTKDGQEVFRNPIRVQKALPEKCWDGSLPDPVTLVCPIQDT